MRGTLSTILLLSGLVTFSSAWAGPGISGGQVFQQEIAARPAALAGAFAASGGDSASLESNPAGLHSLEINEIQFMHAAGFEGLSTEFLVASVPLPGLGVAALHALYRGQPPIDNAVPGEPAVEVKDIVFGLALARPLAFQGKLTLGVNAKLALIYLGPVETSALAVDVGFQYAANEQLVIGLAGRNLGPSGVAVHGSEDPLPASVLAAARYVAWKQDKHDLAASLQADYLVPEQAYVLRAGGEYWYQDTLAFRLGYAHSQTPGVQGLTAGVGFRFRAGRVGIAIDYAYLPQLWTQNDFESENIISLGVRF